MAYSIEHAMKRHGEKFRKLDIDGLRSRYMLELFKSCAFSASEIDSRQELQLISEQIVKKFMGSPLVVVWQLWNENDRSLWCSIVDKKFQHFAGPSVMDVLKLSYLNLSSEVQACFRYCSMFPPKHMFKIEDLIDLLISLGLVLPRQQDGLSMEATARRYFNILRRKSLFCVPAPVNDHYVMHDLVYELTCFVSTKVAVRLKLLTTSPVFLFHLLCAIYVLME